MTDLKIVPLPQPTDATEDLVAVLEALLERARKGDMEAFIFAGLMRSGGMVRARHAPDGARYAIIGAVSYELHNLHQIMDQDDERTLFRPGEGA